MLQSPVSLCTSLRETAHRQADMAGGIVLRVAHRFQQRFVEWLAATQIMLAGVVLLDSADTFALSPTYSIFVQYASEDQWGLFLFGVGAMRLLGLLVNGARQDITPWIRAIGAVIGFFTFGFFNYAALTTWWTTATPGLGLAIYGPAMIAEVASFYYSLRDAKAYRDGIGKSS